MNFQLFTLMQVDCIPWDYPIPSGKNLKTDLPLCTSYVGDGYNNSLITFDNAMSDSKNSQHCKEVCLPNCIETTYAYTIDTTDIVFEDQQNCNFDESSATQKV
jgi:hypothetical protein